jgi:hypothetical protein
MEAVNEMQTRLLRQKDEEIANIRTQWQLEAEKYAEQEHRQEQEAQELRMEIRHHLQARQERERAGLDYMEAELFNYSHKLWQVNERVEQMIKSEKFTRQDLPGESLLNPMDLDEKLGQIESDLECIVPPHTLERVTFLSESDLGCLVRTISIGRAGEREEAAWLRTTMLKFDAETVVRALLIGALHDWVFQSKFPKFVPTDLRLLGVYREIVAEHGKFLSQAKALRHRSADRPRWLETVT